MEQSKIDLNDMKIFVKIVDFGGFSRAAEALALPKSSLSRAITRLEEQVGSALLLRTTRQISLTAVGLKLYDAARLPLIQLESVQSVIDEELNAERGRVRLTAPLDMGLMILNPIIQDFHALYPQVQFDVVYSDDFMDLVRDGFDLAIRVSRPASSNYKMRKLGDVRFVLAASRSYLAQSEKLETLDDLRSHRTLHFSRVSKKNVWRFVHKNGVSEQVSLKPFVMSNHIDTAIDMARRDMGVALVPEFLMNTITAEQRLVRVLTEWSSPSSPVYWVTPEHKNNSQAVQLFSKFAIDKLKLRLA